MNNLNGLTADWILWCVTAWNENDEYKGSTKPTPIFEEAEKEYEKLLNQYENVALNKIEEHWTIIKSKFS